MNNYIWNKIDVDLLPDEIAPWKLARDKHATISVLTHAIQELHTVDDYFSRCKQQFEVEYIKPMHGTTEQAWKAAKAKLNAQFNKRKRNVVLECLHSAAIKCSGTASQTNMKSRVTLKNAIPLPWIR